MWKNFADFCLFFPIFPLLPDFPSFCWFFFFASFSQFMAVFAVNGAPCPPPRWLRHWCQGHGKVSFLVFAFSFHISSYSWFLAIFVPPFCNIFAHSLPPAALSHGYATVLKRYIYIFLKPLLPSTKHITISQKHLYLLFSDLFSDFYLLFLNFYKKKMYEMNIRMRWVVQNIHNKLVNYPTNIYNIIQIFCLQLNYYFVSYIKLQYMYNYVHLSFK